VAFVKVLSCYFCYFAGCREIHDRFRAFLGCNRKELGEANEARNQAPALVTKTCRDESGM
jgi:hypothetical protein